MAHFSAAICHILNHYTVWSIPVSFRIHVLRELLTISEGFQNDSLLTDFVKKFSPSVLTDKIFISILAVFQERIQEVLKLNMNLLNLKLKVRISILIVCLTYQFGKFTYLTLKTTQKSFKFPFFFNKIGYVYRELCLLELFPT